jgi:hypothetical protein
MYRAFVTFRVGGVTEDYTATALVRYGDESASGNTENASYNSTTEKWEAAFDVSSFTDGDFGWRPEATLCDSTNVGSSQQQFFEDFACSLNVDPYTGGVWCDLVDLKFYVGGFGEYSSDDITAVVRYGDETGSMYYTAAATYDSSTERWEVDDLLVEDFTDGDFYWRPEASVGICDMVGNNIFKHFRPGQCR